MYGNEWTNVSARYVDNKEDALGIEKVKSTKDTGFERFRNLGDLVAAGDNSATISILKDPWNYNTLFHQTYQNQASQFTTPDNTTTNGWVNSDKSI